MSNTKGSMLISNANAVGTELVNQLGGTGYKPSEWSDAINLLGISDDDKASALAGITEGTYTGNERGAIKYSNCNAVGAMLTKKFSTNRGFKPVEWESAISKLTPLAEGTVSGSICNIVNGAEDVPLKNWLVTLPASLDGYTEVNGTKNTGTGTPETQYTANLGRTIYGGTADIVTGEGEDDGAVVTLDENGSYGISLGSTTNRIAVNFYNSVGKTDGTFVSNELTTGENSSGGYKNDEWVVWGSTIAPRMWISVPLTIDTVDKFKQYLQNNPITIAYELATATAFTFTPINAETALGVNNFWSEQGDSSVTYRKDPDIPDPPVQLLNMNNNENNNNEGV